MLLSKALILITYDIPTLMTCIWSKDIFMTFICMKLENNCIINIYCNEMLMYKKSQIGIVFETTSLSLLLSVGPSYPPLSFTQITTYSPSLIKAPSILTLIQRLNPKSLSLIPHNNRPSLFLSLSSFHLDEYLYFEVVLLNFKNIVVVLMVESLIFMGFLCICRIKKCLLSYSI